MLPYIAYMDPMGCAGSKHLKTMCGKIQQKPKTLGGDRYLGTFGILNINEPDTIAVQKPSDQRPENPPAPLVTGLLLGDVHQSQACVIAGSTVDAINISRFPKSWGYPQIIRVDFPLTKTIQLLEVPIFRECL